MRLFPFLLLLIIGNSCLSQDYDSKEKKAALYLQKAKDSLFTKPRTSLKLLNRAIEISNSDKSDTVLTESVFWLAWLQVNQTGEFHSVKENIEKVFERLKTNPNPELEAKTILLQSNYEKLKNGNTELALELLRKALKMFEKTGNRRLQAECFCKIGGLFANQRDYQKAKNYYDKGIGMAENIKAAKSLSICYAGLAVNYGRQGETEEAIRLQKMVIELDSIEEMDIWQAKNHLDLGVSYWIQGDFETAYELTLTALDWAKKFEDLDQLTKCYIDLGHSSINLGDNKKSKKYFDTAIELADSTGNLFYREMAYRGMSLPMFNLKEYKDAYNYLEYSNILKDSLFDQNQNQKFAELEIQYQTKEKEKEIALQSSKLARQRITGGLIGFVALLLLGFGIFAYRTAQHRKKTNHQLRQLDKAKSRFFSNISHELRTPLTLLLAPLEESIEMSKSNAQKEHLELAHSNGKKLLTLINEILDLSKLESGKMQLNERPVELEKLLRRILFSYQSLANLRSFYLSFSYNLPNDLTVNLDIEKFEKILNNLLSNAFKHSNPEGVITLKSFENSKGLIQIEVQDQGTGIALEELPKIFDRFYQIENENEPLQGGTGIGLAYAKELAKLFGGDLRVESEKGKGSVFILTVRMRKAKASLPPAPLKGELPPTPKPEKVSTENEYAPLTLNGKKPRILIVEDNPEMSRFLVQLLQNHYQCKTAFDGKNALELLEKEQFDLITSDVMMPNMDGFTFLKTLRENQKYQNIPFILLTARSLEEDKLKGLQLGTDDYLTKPFNKKELLARTHNLLKNKSMREEWLAENIKTDTEKTISETLPAEKEMLKKAEESVLNNLSNSNYSVESLAGDLAYSKRQLTRIIRKQTGMSPLEFIREIKLQKAMQLILEKQFLTISEVSYEVGFENPSYFARKFGERFGKKPSEV